MMILGLDLCASAKLSGSRSAPWDGGIGSNRLKIAGKYLNRSVPGCCRCAWRLYDAQSLAGRETGKRRLASHRYWLNRPFRNGLNGAVAFEGRGRLVLSRFGDGARRTAP